MANMLLISCSQTKKPIHKCKAIELYDGPYYRVIRKLRRENEYPIDTDLYILSAQYGIIHESDEIEFYDMKMTMDRARELRDCNLSVLAKIIVRTNYLNILINLGRTYLESIRGYEKFIPPFANVQVCSGEIGERMSQMRNWLLHLRNMEGEG